MHTLKELSFERFRQTGSHYFSKPGVIFTGANGSGKSTRLDALRLTLMGYLPEQGKQASTMMQNATMDNMGVSLSLYLDSAEHSISRWYEGSIKSAKAECKIEPDGIAGKECEYWISQNLKIHPLILNNDFFRLSEPEQQKTFLSICKPLWTIEMVNLELEKRRIDPISGMVPERELIALMTRIKKMITDGQADIRSQKSHIKKLTERLSEFSELTGNVADKKERRDQLQTDLQSVTTQIARIEAKPHHEQLLQENREGLERFQSKKTLAETDMAQDFIELKSAENLLAELQLNDINAQWNTDLQSAKTSLGIMEIFDLMKPESIPVGTNCLACGTSITPETIAGLRAGRAKNILAKTRLKNKITEIETQIRDRETSRERQGTIVGAIKSGIRVAQSNITRLDKDIADIKATIVKQEAYLAIELPDIEALKSQQAAMTAEIGTLNADIENLQRKKEVMVSIDEAKAAIEKLEDDIPLWQDNIKSIIELLDKIIRESKKSFLEPAAQFVDQFKGIGTPDIILVDIDTGKECFKYGKKTDNGFVPYIALSAGEKKVYETAFLIGVLANTENRFPLMIVDNLHDLDASRMTQYFKAIEGLLQAGTIVNFIGASTSPIYEDQSEWLDVVEL